MIFEVKLDYFSQANVATIALLADKREFRLAQAHGITELVFSPAWLLHLIELVRVRAL